MEQNQILESHRAINNTLNYSDSNIEIGSNVIKQLIGIVIGFILSASRVCGQISPFGISFLSVVSTDLSLSTAAGALLGYFFSGLNNTSYIISIILIILLRIIFDKINPLILSSISVFSSMLLFEIILKEKSFYNSLMVFSLIIMTIGATFVFYNAKKIIDSKLYYKNLDHREIVILLLCLFILMTLLMSFKIWGLSIGNVLGLYILLVSSKIFPISHTVIISLINSCAVLINETDISSYIIISYILAGVFSNLIKKYNNILISVCFSLINLSGAVITSLLEKKNIIPENIFEVLIASLIFVLTVNMLKGRFWVIIDPKEEILNSQNIRSLMLLKLTFISKTLKDIANSTQRLSHKITKQNETINDIYYRATEKVCYGCKLKMICWNNEYNNMINSFNEMTSSLKEAGAITESDIPIFIKQRCKNITEIISNINNYYKRYIVNKGANRKVEEIRSLIPDQFEAISMMLSDLSREFYEIRNFDKSTAVKAKHILSKSGLKIYSITSFTDRYGHLMIEAIGNINHDSDYNINTNNNTAETMLDRSLILELSETCCRKFNKPCLVKLNNNMMKLTIIEKTNYEIDFGATQFSSDGSNKCGDSYNYFIDSKGRAYMLISDGMGTGQSAHLDGAITTSLLSKLLLSGFEFESASKIVNTTLLIKPGEESLSTMDLTTIDLYSGQVDFFKAGAAPTFIKKSGRVLEIGSSTLPVGILNDMKFDKKTNLLKENDLIIMVSDGITNNDYSWLYEEIKSYKYNLTAKELSRKIALESKFRNKLKHDDDITVLVGIVGKGA